MAAPPELADAPATVRGAPPRAGGPLVLLRFLASHRMLTFGNARLLARLAWIKLRFPGAPGRCSSSRPPKTRSPPMS
jgi:hypothetical protein